MNIVFLIYQLSKWISAPCLNIQCDANRQEDKRPFRSLSPSLFRSHTHTRTHTKLGTALPFWKSAITSSSSDAGTAAATAVSSADQTPLALPNQRYLSHLLWRAIKSLKHRLGRMRPRRGIKGSVELIRAGEDSRCHLRSLTYHWLFKSHLKAAKWAGQTGSTATPERASVSFNT